MLTTIKTAALSAFIAFGALAAAPAAANADSLHIVYKNGDLGFGVNVGHGPYGYKGCSTGKALQKAKWMGLKKPYVAANGKNKIVVAGKKYGHYKFVTFAKAPGCPVKW